MSEMSDMNEMNEINEVLEALPGVTEEQLRGIGVEELYWDRGGNPCGPKEAVEAESYLRLGDGRRLLFGRHGAPIREMMGKL
jgi:hypothetical protein